VPVKLASFVCPEAQAVFGGLVIELFFGYCLGSKLLGRRKASRFVQKILDV
jgi:hypothetical protein